MITKDDILEQFTPDEYTQRIIQETKDLDLMDEIMKAYGNDDAETFFSVGAQALGIPVKEADLEAILQFCGLDITNPGGPTPQGMNDLRRLKVIEEKKEEDLNIWDAIEGMALYYRERERLINLRALKAWDAHEEKWFRSCNHHSSMLMHLISD